MRNRTTTSRRRRKRRGSEIVHLRLVNNSKRQTALGTNEHVDNSEILESSGNEEDAKNKAELSSIRPNIDYSDILVSYEDMTKVEGNTDFSGDICERIRQSMFVEDEILQINDEKETSDTNVSNCSGNSEIPTEKDDGHRSRQVQENEISITAGKYVATQTRQDEHFHEQSDLKSIPLDIVCNSNKDEGSEIDRKMIGSDETREEGEIYEDEYVQKQLIQDFSSLRKYLHEAFGFKPKKRRQPELKEERGSKQRRYKEAQNLNNKRSHFLQPSAEKEIWARNVSYNKGKTEISNKGLVNSDCHRSGQGNVPSITSRKYDHVTTEEHKVKENIHELGDLKSISSDTTRIADESLGTDKEKTASSELREEGEIYEDVQTQPKKLIKTVQKRDDDVVNVRSNKRRQTGSKDERRSKRRRDSDEHYVKNSRPHLQHKTNVSDRRRYTDTSDQRSPRPLHIYHQKEKYLTTDPRTSEERNVFIPDYLSEERCHLILDQNQTYIERSSFRIAVRNSGLSSSPVLKYDQRRDPPSPTSSISIKGRKQNRSKSHFVQRRDKREQIRRGRDNETLGFRDLKNKSLHDGKGTFDFASESNNYGRDIYRRNREQSGWECPSRNKNNRNSADHQQNEGYRIPRLEYDSRFSSLNDDSYNDNRTDVTNYDYQTPFERRDMFTTHTEERKWEGEHVSKEKLNFHDKNDRYPRNDTCYHVTHSDKIWESRISNTRPSAKRFGIIPSNRTEINDRKYGLNVEYSFLGTLKYLSRPCHSNDEIANILATRSDELSQYLRKNEKCPNLSSLVNIFARCVECKVSTTSMRTVMYILRTNRFFERKDVIDSLKQMRTIPTNSSSDQTFIYGLLLVMKAMIDTVNLEENDTTIARSLIESIINHRSEDVSLVRQSIVLKAITESFERKQKKREENGEIRGELFAETLPILPDIDIIRQVKDTDIPKHDIGQKFENDRHYVSHMFVLFREDFIRPLCKGVRDYISYRERGSVAKFRSTDVRLFEDVRLHSAVSNVDNGIVWTVQFEFKVQGNCYIPSVLQYGSLLCLSPDDFKTMCYATVVNRDYLQHGHIDIKFLNHNDMAAYVDKSFVMLESRAFYEAYSHTLSLLKELALGLVQGKLTLPFGKYLLGNTSHIEHPKYLVECGHISFTCLKSYRDGRTARINSLSEVKVLDSTTWPSSKDLGLDISQHEALKLALTKEISLIQGPPGTGKTTMGIRIAELLLHNKHAWRGNKQKPMLLVSYTNHALDQFLQLLLNTPVMANCLRKDVVRVGSRCEIEHLDKFTLKSHRKLQKPNLLPFLANYAQLTSIEAILVQLMNSIKCYKACLVHERTFREMDLIPAWMYNQLVGHLYRERLQSANETSLWIWLDLHSLSNRTELSSNPGKQSTQSGYVTKKEFMNEEFERVLDDVEVERDVTIMSQDDFAMCPAVAIDDGILREDPYYQHIDKNQISGLMESIIQELSVKDRMTKEETEKVKDIWRLSTVDRWRLYRYWVFEATFPLYQQLYRHEREYDDASRRYLESRNHLDCKIMKDACLVAMTTTAAARYTNILQEVAPAVVIIEEAAQVSEQHVLGALSSACQHLIMIGDHQQLQPAYNDYDLVRMHHTDVSLFERLIRNGMCYQQLENQHRMRPEIASLLVPHIYKSLKNHESVFKYSDIKGIASNVFFIAHEEEEDNFDESSRHSNTYEAEFISKLYRHLRLQGYFQHEITVLSFYKDQVQLLRKKIRKLEQRDEFLMNISPERCTENTLIPGDISAKSKIKNKPEVRITAVDNFQGEENRIVLLSLVRSNKNKKIGYLQVPNRVCVALSRAREGFFVIGNMTCLRQSSTLWEKVISKVHRSGLCGKHLELKCVNHKDTKMIVKTPRDFEKYKDGGCNQPCTHRMDCGHTCSRKCHNDDPDHKIPCKKVCEKYCENGHCHEKLCYEPIGKCKESDNVILPRCGHTKVKMCFEDASEVKCDERCDKELTCGHICQRRCGEVCNDEDNCTELIMVTDRCGHECQIACSHQKDFLCKIPCQTILDCGHSCSGTCGKCLQGRLHIPCRKKCKRILICGHPCRANCTEWCPPCEKVCLNACEHSKCSKKCGEPFIQCREPCQWKCQERCPNGFTCTQVCSEDCNRPRCDVPCERIISTCRHKCIALNCEKCICRECEEGIHFEILFRKEDDPRAIFYRLEDCCHIFELSSLDEYMDKKDSEKHVGMKVCPRCTTPILRSKRYGNVIRECRRKIDAVKRKIGCHDITQDRNKVFKATVNLEIKDDRQFFQLCIALTRDKKEVTAIRNQLNFYLRVTKSIEDINSKYKNIILEEKRRNILKELDGLRKWTLIKRFRFSKQELSEFKLELTRVRLSLRVELLMCSLQKLENVPQCDTEWIEMTKKELNSGEKLNVMMGKTVEIKLKQLEKQYPHSGLGISDDERIMVLKAMGFSQKGHVYAIGDCGGAMTEGKCPECQETIGGSTHRLMDDNQLASKMDGAKFSAWSEQANMQNYDVVANLDEML
ncbi:hypothetical protein ACJMK2_012500 [Sinanodonta woodiana]|uniref:RZ-type domain-containing protein n=1 Tax=Sinanodonta woodiana TaxID=1069815 RepID=A0ABD3V8E6_SINWO